jgi:hypothetical protein
MPNIQNAPDGAVAKAAMARRRPSPLFRGKRDGGRQLRFRSLEVWSLFDYWCLEFGYYHIGL